MADQTNAEVSDERLRERADALWEQLLPHMQVAAHASGARSAYDDKVAAIGFIMAELNRRSVTSQASEGEAEPTEGDGKMQRVSEVIKYFNDVLERFGDSCVYVRRGGVAWGAVALNRESDDKKNGVFDLQEQHDRDMQARLGQIERLIADRNEWRDKALVAPVSKRVERLETLLTQALHVLDQPEIYTIWPVSALRMEITQALQGGRS